MNTRPVPHQNVFQAGFTLIEVLVAIAILAVILTFSGGILSSLHLNNRSNGQLTINQASSSYLETVSNIWSIGDYFGNTKPEAIVKTNIALGGVNFPTPADVPGTTWSTQVCTLAVNPTTSAVTETCGTAVTSGTPAYATLYKEVPKSVTLIRVNVTYTKGSSSAITNSLEVSRP